MGDDMAYERVKLHMVTYLRHVLIVLIMWKINFVKKSVTSHCEFDNITTPYYRFCSIICQLVAYVRLKTKGNVKLSALKVVAVAYEVLTYKRWKMSRFDWETFSILENWSLRGVLSYKRWSQRPTIDRGFLDWLSLLITNKSLMFL